MGVAAFARSAFRKGASDPIGKGILPEWCVVIGALNLKRSELLMCRLRGTHYLCIEVLHVGPEDNNIAIVHTARRVLYLTSRTSVLCFDEDDMLAAVVAELRKIAIDIE